MSDKLKQDLFLKMNALSGLDLSEILEAARVALTDERLIPLVGDELDLSDEHFQELSEKLHRILN